MGKKVGKPRKVPPDQSDPAPRAVRLGSATSNLPQPLQAAVGASDRGGILRDEPDNVVGGRSNTSDATEGHLRPGEVVPSSNRPKTSRPVAELLMQRAGWIEAALEVHGSTDSESVKADAAQWVRAVLDNIEDEERHQSLIYGVSLLSQPQLVVRGGREWYAPFLPDFWRWYAAHAEFACELIAAIIRWNSCRGNSSEERIKKFLIKRPAITVRGEVFMVHSGITSSLNTLPPTATDPQICEAFREFIGQDVSPKLVGNARQRWFGNDQRYRADLVRRVALFLK